MDQPGQAKHIGQGDINTHETKEHTRQRDRHHQRWQTPEIGIRRSRDRQSIKKRLNNQPKGQPCPILNDIDQNKQEKMLALKTHQTQDKSWSFHASTSVISPRKSLAKRECTSASRLARPPYSRQTPC